MSQLTGVSVLTDIIESPADVMQLLSALMQACPKLSSLLLEFDLDIQVPPVVSESRIQMEHLTPLLACSTLTVFSLDYLYALAFDDKDIEEMTSHLKELEVLSLNPYVKETPKPKKSLTLESLLSFAHHCPRIRELGLFLSQADVTVITSEEILAKFLSTSLHWWFHVGNSYITHPMKVAFFLREILPLGAEIDYCELCPGWEQVNLLFSSID
ncbi:hypothetical protein K435DRAFT_924721, partial [Dendrothele bispora CBS 962.96]